MSGTRLASLEEMKSGIGVPISQGGGGDEYLGEVVLPGEMGGLRRAGLARKENLIFVRGTCWIPGTGVPEAGAP